MQRSKCIGHHTGDPRGTSISTVDKAVVGIGGKNNAHAFFLPNAMGDLDDIVYNVQIFRVKARQFLLFFVYCRYSL